MPYKDPEEAKRHRKEYYLRNRDKMNVVKHAYYLKHKAEWRRRNYAQRKKHPEWRRAYRRRMHQRKRNFLINSLGGKCSLCGFSENDILEVHHVKNDPVWTKRDRTRMEEFSWSQIKLMLPNLKLLCPNCHHLSHLDKQNRIQYRSSRLYGKDQRRRIKQRKQEFIINRLGGECSKCGYATRYILEVHHVNGAPKHWSRHLTSVGYSKIESEISNGNLILLCPNCHTSAHPAS